MLAVCRGGPALDGKPPGLEDDLMITDRAMNSTVGNLRTARVTKSTGQLAYHRKPVDLLRVGDRTTMLSVARHERIDR